MSERNNWVTLAAYEHLENDAISLRDLYHAQCREAAELTRQRDALLGACKRARRYIINGIEFGYISPPDPLIEDSANETLPAIEAAIALAKEVEGG